MSVFIKGFDLPECCDRCPLYSRVRTCCVLYSQGYSDRYNYDISKRPEWCEMEDAEKVYMKHYRQGRLDELSIIEGRLMQSFNPD